MVSGLERDVVVVGAILLVSGLVTGWLGYRIRYRGDVHLIAGYRREMATDTDALARVVGRAVLAVGGVTICAGLGYPLVAAGSDSAGIYWTVYTFVVVLLSGYAVVVGRRHVSPP
jgi:hypothetical protein